MNKVDWDHLWQQKNNYKLQNKHMMAIEMATQNGLLDKESKVADIGCGTGIFLKFLRDQYQIKELTGIDNNDFSKSSLESLNINYIKYDLSSTQQNISLSGFQTGFLIDVLEHFFYPENIINNLNSFNNIVFVVPNFSFIKERLEVALGLTPFQLKPKRGGHCFWMNINSIKDFVSKTNFEIKDIKYSYPKKLKFLTFKNLFANLLSTSFTVYLKKKN